MWFLWLLINVVERGRLKLSLQPYSYIKFTSRFITPLWLMRVLMFLIGAGMAYAMQPAQVAAFATISSASTGRASALNNAQRQVGAALGVAVLSSVISAVGATRLSATGATVPNLAAYHAAFFAAAVLELIAVGWALTIHDSDATVTLRRPARQAKEVGGARV